MALHTTHNVTDLSDAERRSLEGLLGSPLEDSQQVIVMAVAPSSERDSAAPGLLKQYMGIVRSGDADLANNARIDADLARAYGDSHEA